MNKLHKGKIPRGKETFFYVANEDRSVAVVTIQAGEHGIIPATYHYLDEESPEVEDCEFLGGRGCSLNSIMEFPATDRNQLKTDEEIYQYLEDRLEMYESVQSEI